MDAQASREEAEEGGRKKGGPRFSPPQRGENRRADFAVTLREPRPLGLAGRAGLAPPALFPLFAPSLSGVLK